MTGVTFPLTKPYARLYPNTDPPMPIVRASKALFASQHIRAALLLVCATSLLGGCGEIILPYLSAPGDFTVTVVPDTSTTTPGIAAPAYSFIINPSGAFNGQISAAIVPPAGFTCAPVSCSAALPSYSPTPVLQLTPGVSVAPGAYPLTFTATSGSRSHTATATLTVAAIPPTPDFALSVAPVATTVVAGNAVPVYSFAVTPINGFTGPVTISWAPLTGFSCNAVPCTATVSTANASNGLQFNTAATLASGTYSLAFTGTSGTLSHTITASVVVTAQVPPPPPPPLLCAAAVPPIAPADSSTGFVYTGDPAPTGVVYDALHNRIFASNLQLNEIDVISPEALTIVARLPVPQPAGLDISADGTTLIIGTRTHYFYRATTDTLCITDRHYLTINPPLNNDLSPMYPTALADGSVLFAAYDVASTAQSVYLWTAAGGFTEAFPSGFPAYSVRNIIPSTDRMHAFISEDDSGGAFARYDVGGGTLVRTVSFGSQPQVLAVNTDGSRVLVNLDCCGITLTDDSFNILGSYKGLRVGSATAEPDFSRFYFTNATAGSTTGSITVTDGTLNPIGSMSAPFNPIITSVNSQFRGFDGEHRILALATDGISLLNTSQLNPLLANGALVPTFEASGSMYGAAQPSVPQNGFQTQLSGGDFTMQPTSVLFTDNNLSEAASGISLAPSGVDVTAPSFPSGCADVAMAFPSGFSAFAPQAYCYTPSVYVVDGDSGPTTGGSTLTLYGIGFGTQSPGVSVGGAVSPQVTLTQSYAQGIPIALSSLKVTVPPGNFGPADITVTTSFGSTTLAHAFNYVQRADHPLPSGTSPYQLLLDASRGRVLITDAANSQLLVYDESSGALLQSVPTGPTPQGISLTPDGTRLLLLTAGDYKLSVLDAGSYSMQQQVTLPASTQSVFGLSAAGPGIQVGAMAGNKAYVLTQAGYLQGPAGAFSFTFVYDYDLGTNSVTPDPINKTYLLGGAGYYMASSADGSAALLGGQLSHGVGTALTPPDTTLPGYGDMSLANDGHVASMTVQLFDSSNRWQMSVSASSSQTPSTSEVYFYGAQFNATGSLYYRETAEHIRIFDVEHGDLVRTLEVPGGLSGQPGTNITYPTRLLALDPGGREIITVTPAGLSTFTFASDPLSVAQATVSGGMLTITGSGFSSSSTVNIGTLTVPANFIDANHLTVTLPALASGNHSVTVTAPNAIPYTLQLAFTT